MVRWRLSICVRSGMFSERVTDGEGEPETDEASSPQAYQLSHGGGHIWLGNHVPSEQMFIQTIVELPVPQCGLWCWGVQSGVMCTT